MFGNWLFQFTHISSSFYHSVGVTETGEVFEWGRNPQEVKMKMFLMRRLRSAQLKNATEGTGENGTEQPVVNVRPFLVRSEFYMAHNFTYELQRRDFVSTPMLKDLLYK